MLKITSGLVHFHPSIDATNSHLLFAGCFTRFRPGCGCPSSWVDMPNSVTCLNRTPISKWYVVRCASQNGYSEDMCIKEIGLCAQFLEIVLGSIVHTIEGPLHTRAKNRDHEIVRAQKKVSKRISQHNFDIM